jgi:hypothetical protein
LQSCQKHKIAFVPGSYYKQCAGWSTPSIPETIGPAGIAFYGGARFFLWTNCRVWYTLSAIKISGFFSKFGRVLGNLPGKPRRSGQKGGNGAIARMDFNRKKPEGKGRTDDKD